MCDEEIFEINDFSTSSDWERFISDLEEILTQWNLNTNISRNDTQWFKIDQDNLDQKSPINKLSSRCSNISSSKLFADSRRWQQKQESIKFGKVSFTLQYFCFNKKDLNQLNNPNDTFSDLSEQKKTKSEINFAWNDMLSIENDWPASGHPLVRYYGLSQFLVLMPLNGEIISTEDRARHLIGSAAIALHNIDCEVPFFCQISALYRRLFMGVGHLSNGFRTYYEMIQFPEVPHSYQYFNELMVLFKKKLYSSFSYVSNVITREEEETKVCDSNDAPKVQVSIRFTYILTKWPTEYLLFNVNQQQQLLDSAETSFLTSKFSYFRSSKSDLLISEPVANFTTDLFGDPLIQMQLATTWPSVAEELITDNAYHSDLQPQNAPRWSLRVLFLDDSDTTKISIFCPITESLRIFTEIPNKYKPKSQLLNYLKNDQGQDHQQNVRQALDRLSSPTSALDIHHTTSHLLTSMSNLVLQDESKLVPLEKIEQLVKNLFNQKQSNDLEIVAEKDDLFKKLKSAPINSLSWRLANLCSNLYSQTKQISTVAQIWKCFLDQLRDHWQSGQLLPHMIDKNNESIDYAHSLFHQKLQMLNCCIRQKIKREFQNQNQSSDIPKESIEQDYESEKDSDDEFFDAEDEITQAEGLLHPLVDSQGQPMDLLSKPGVQIQVPQTQDPAPMTEDALAKQVASLSQIDDPKLKIRLQSSSLLSDMEAFKAANPGCQFEDFIRWHSPRDWTETTNVSGDKTEFGLSRRMKESNTWNELWQLARACPIRRQKRLFNYTKEAEEILQYFQKISIEDFNQLLNPVIVKSIIRKFSDYRREISEFFQENCPDLSIIDDIEESFPIKIPMMEHFLEKSDYTDLCSLLRDLEYGFIKFYSLFKKFQHSYENYFRGKSRFETIFQQKQKKSTKSVPSSVVKPNSNRSTSLFLAKTMTMKSSTELNGQDFLQFLWNLLHEPEVEFSNATIISQLIVQIFSDADRFQYEQNTSIGERIPKNLKYNDYDNDDDNFKTNEVSINKRSQSPITKFASLPKPTGKEFIIRAKSIARPAPYSRPSSNRMYCLLSKDFRLATAFTEDTGYF